MITGVGLSNMQYTNQGSMRNIFILGFSLFNGLSISSYFEAYTESEEHGPVDTGSSEFNGATCVSRLSLYIAHHVHGSPLRTLRRQQLHRALWHLMSHLDCPCTLIGEGEL